MKEADLLTLATAILGSGMVAVVAKWVLARLTRPTPHGYKRVIRVDKADGTTLIYEADEDEIVTRSDAKKIIRWLDSIQKEHGEDAVRNFSYSLVPKNEVADAEHLEDPSSPEPSPPSES